MIWGSCSGSQSRNLASALSRLRSGAAVSWLSVMAWEGQSPVRNRAGPSVPAEFDCMPWNKARTQGELWDLSLSMNMGEKGVSVKKLLLVDGAIQFSNQRSNKQLNHGGGEQRQKMPWEKEIEGGGEGKGSRSKSEETKQKMAWTSWYTSFSDAFKKRAGKVATQQINQVFNSSRSWPWTLIWTTL